MIGPGNVTPLRLLSPGRFTWGSFSSCLQGRVLLDFDVIRVGGDITLLLLWLKQPLCCSSRPRAVDYNRSL